MDNLRTAFVIPAVNDANLLSLCPPTSCASYPLEILNDSCFLGSRLVQTSGRSDQIRAHGVRGQPQERYALDESLVLGDPCQSAQSLVRSEAAVQWGLDIWSRGNSKKEEEQATGSDRL